VQTTLEERQQTFLNGVLLIVAAEVSGSPLTFVDTDGAVFGLPMTPADPPAWLGDDSVLAHFIAAKDEDEPTPELWWRLAELARACVRLASVVPIADAGPMSHYACRLAIEVAEWLPLPRARLCDNPLRDTSAEEFLVCAADPLRDVSYRMSEDLACRWVDPDVVRGHVYDALNLLARYYVAVRTHSRTSAERTPSLARKPGRRADARRFLAPLCAVRPAQT
jgi:hypothetical protein